MKNLLISVATVVFVFSLVLPSMELMEVMRERGNRIFIESEVDLNSEYFRNKGKEYGMSEEEAKDYADKKAELFIRKNMEIGGESVN